MFKQYESGRSIVEVLGVLAVIGVLSVGGIIGYNIGMTKHRTNELLDGASKRAMTVSTQMMLKASPNLDGYTNYNETAGGTFSGTVMELDNSQFALLVDNVQKETCITLIKSIGNRTPLRNITAQSDTGTPLTIENCQDGNNQLALIFDKDLRHKAETNSSGSNSSSGGSTPSSSGGEDGTDNSPTCQPACTGGKECVSDNTCACPDGKEWCSGWETPSCATNCCTSLYDEQCQTCSSTGIITNKSNTTSCTINNKAGTCDGNGTCVENTDCPEDTDTNLAVHKGSDGTTCCNANNFAWTGTWYGAYSPACGCPDGGELKGPDGNQVCCKDGAKLAGSSYYDTSDARCAVGGCPEDTDTNLDVRKGSDGTTCCNANNFAWTGTWYGAYNPACGCPKENGISAELKGSEELGYICCQGTAPFKNYSYWGYDSRCDQ